MCTIKCLVVLLLLLVTDVLRGATALSFRNRLVTATTTVAKVAQIPVDRLSRGTTVPSTAEPVSRVRVRHKTHHSSVFRLDPTDPFTFGFTHVGKIVGAHGIRGEIKVLLEPANEGCHAVVTKNSVVYVRKPNRKTPRPVRVAQCRRQGSKDQTQHVLLLQLEGVATRTMAETFTKYMVYVRHEDTTKQRSNEYLVRDLVGLNCYRLQDMSTVQQLRGLMRDKNMTPDAGRPIPGLQPLARVVGVVPPEELCDSPAAAKLMHAQLELRLLRATATGDQRERPPYRHCLVPLVPSIVHTVDVEHGCLFLDPPEGLLDMTYVFEEKALPLKGFLPAASSSLSTADRQYLAQRCKEQASSDSDL